VLFSLPPLLLADISNFFVGFVIPIPTEPSEVIRSLSLPAVSTVNVSAAGNLIAVSVSPAWTILSTIDISPPSATLKTSDAPS